APGVAPAQARAELDATSAALAREFPESNLGWDAGIEGAREWIVGAEVRERLVLLLAAVVVLMLVACTNVANLQIARAAARQREMGVRQALGARRGRLVGQMVTENALLAAIGGVLGLALAQATLQAAVAVLPPETPRLAAFALDWRAAALAVAVAATTAIAFGLLPALAAMRTQLAAVLQQLGRSSVDGGRSRLRQGLVVVQFTLATMLVVASALLAQHLDRLQRTSLGFSAERLLVARMTLPQSGEDMDLGPHLALYERLLDEIAGVPGVRSAGITSEIPLGDFNTSMMVAPGAGTALTYEHDSLQASWRVVSSDYLATLGVPLLRGRSFARSGESARSIILSDGLARRLFPGTDPVGQTIRLGNGQMRNVIGVAGDVRQVGLGEEPTPTMYMPTNWIVTPTMTLLVRSEGDPAAIVAPVRAIAERLSPDYPLFDVRTMDTVITTSVAEPRVQALVLLAFAGASLLLAAFGVAGVMAYLVTRRAPELAIRMALGASPRALVRHVVGAGAMLCFGGVLLGGALLYASAQSWGALAPDADVPAMLALGGALLLAVGLLASWIPARRVARISPNLALREA
ncbi:MAG TPA: FtsX-like permease family protein, partial [Xanthomonadales bacterium]|nr:FtsX-like permease family protein [Xanthomonadales bacterium]